MLLIDSHADADGNDEPVKPDLKILNINLVGVMYTVKLAVHYLNRNGENRDRALIMTASLAGYLDQPGSPQYCSSKWGVRGIMRALRRTVPRMNMRVNIISPWFVKTPIMSKEVQDLVESKGIQWARKEDAAGAVLHMAADGTSNGEHQPLLPLRASSNFLLTGPRSFLRHRTPRNRERRLRRHQCRQRSTR